MSNKGRYLRGEKWYLLSRNEDGNLVNSVKKDADKMLDINFYLDEQKKLEEEKKETKSKRKK